MQVEAPTWDNVLAPRYGVLQAQYGQWLATARGMIQRLVGEAKPRVMCGELAKRIAPARGGDRRSKDGCPPIDSRKAAANGAGHAPLDDAAIIAELTALLRERPQAEQAIGADRDLCELS